MIGSIEIARSAGCPPHRRERRQGEAQRLCELPRVGARHIRSFRPGDSIPAAFSIPARPVAHRCGSSVEQPHPTRPHRERGSLAEGLPPSPDAGPRCRDTPSTGSMPSIHVVLECTAPTPEPDRFYHTLVHVSDDALAAGEHLRRVYRHASTLGFPGPHRVVGRGTRLPEPPSSAKWRQPRARYGQPRRGYMNDSRPLRTTPLACRLTSGVTRGAHRPHGTYESDTRSQGGSARPRPVPAKRKAIVDLEVVVGISRCVVMRCTRKARRDPPSSR